MFPLATCSTQQSPTHVPLVAFPAHAPQPDAYEFSIRTPVTPPRWKDFDRELAAAFEGCLQALAAGKGRCDIGVLVCMRSTEGPGV